jgi:hypothetical protein
MEGLFDNLLYIVITIVVLAFSMMNKKKKTEQAQRQTSQKPKTIFDPFEEIFAEKETVFEEEYDEEEEILQSDPEFRSILNDPKTTSESGNLAFKPEAKSDFQKIAEEVSAKKTPIQIEEDNMILDMNYDWDKEEVMPEISEFDLKKAVIYSEILNKKYQ